MYSDYFVGSFAERLCLGDVNKPTPAVISPGVGAGYFISPSRKGKKKTNKNENKVDISQSPESYIMLQSVFSSTLTTPFIFSGQSLFK